MAASLLAAALLVVLTETGRTRDGLPVYAIHPRSDSVAAQLDRGASAELLRVYRLLQVRRQKRTGTAIEPAYLLLSTRQGGFARYGFWLQGTKKPDVAYVDVHEGWGLSGRFGAIDQIFPHELSHAMLRQLGTQPPPGVRANQVHAVGVRTDRFTAWNEGLAEHFQIVAVDHPGAAPETTALARRRNAEAATLQRLEEYRRELSSRFAPASRLRMGFPIWYSDAERVFRYFSVKENRFIRETEVPEPLLRARDRYPAYLLENVGPGDGPVKSLARLLVSEGAVSSFFHRWATSDALQRGRGSEAFYAEYGTTFEELTPLQNLYLKLFHAAGERKAADVLQLIDSYSAAFPEEGPVVRGLAQKSFAVRNLEVPPELWLASDRLETGTTIFDQFRASPRVHTFDLNAASVVDLTSIADVTPELARRIIAGGPYQSIGDAGRVAGVTPAMVSRLEAMAARMASLGSEGGESVSISTVLTAYAVRAGLVLLIASAAAAVIHRLGRRLFAARPRTVASVLCGLAAATVAIGVNWVGGDALIALATVMTVFGAPSAMWSLYRNRKAGLALRSAAVWAAMAMPGVLLTTAV